MVRPHYGNLSDCPAEWDGPFGHGYDQASADVIGLLGDICTAPDVVSAAVRMAVIDVLHDK